MKRLVGKMDPNFVNVTVYYNWVRKRRYSYIPTGTETRQDVFDKIVKANEEEGNLIMIEADLFYDEMPTINIIKIVP